MFRFRPFHLFLLLFEFCFLNIVIPVHTRGMVTMGGSGSCCCCCHKSKPHAPTPADEKNCAICNFAAHLMLPPPVDCRLAALGSAEILPVANPIVFHAIAIPTPYHGRAPPALPHA